MLELKTIYKNSKELKFYEELIVDSFNNTRKINNYSTNINHIDELWDILNIDYICIVLRQNKYIGFILNNIHKNNKEISFQIFVYSRACPMSLRSLTKCALFRSMYIIKDDPDLLFFEFVTHHPALVTVIKSYFLNFLETHYLNSNYIICNLNINSEIRNIINSHINKYIGSDYNKNNFKLNF